MDTRCIYWERSTPQPAAREAQDMRERRDLKFVVPNPSPFSLQPSNGLTRPARRSFPDSDASRFTFHVSRFTNAAARAMVGLVVLLALSTFSMSESLAMDIAILRSSDIAAYREAIAGLKATGPIGAIYTEYDVQGDLELGKKLARKLRASNASLVVAVGLKAALAAKVEIVDVPIVYMMILDPLKHQLTADNMTGTLLEVPVDRQLKIMRTFLPTLHQLGTLYDPAKTSSRVKDAITAGHQLRLSIKGAARRERERRAPAIAHAALGR